VDYPGRNCRFEGLEGFCIEFLMFSCRSRGYTSRHRQQRLRPDVQRLRRDVMNDEPGQGEKDAPIKLGNFHRADRNGKF
jgi:hypothetical protein